jgi:hypothetical protein
MRIFRMPRTGGLMQPHFSSMGQAYGGGSSSKASSKFCSVLNAPPRFSSAVPERRSIHHMQPRANPFAAPAVKRPLYVMGSGQWAVGSRQASGGALHGASWQEQEDMLAALSVPRRLQLVNERTAKLLNQPVGVPCCTISPEYMVCVLHDLT